MVGRVANILVFGVLGRAVGTTRARRTRRAIAMARAFPRAERVHVCVDVGGCRTHTTRVENPNRRTHRVSEIISIRGKRKRPTIRQYKVNANATVSLSCATHANRAMTTSHVFQANDL